MVCTHIHRNVNTHTHTSIIMSKCLKSYIKDKEDLEGIQRSRSHAPDALAIKAVTSKQKNNSQRGQTVFLLSYGED